MEKNFLLQVKRHLKQKYNCHSIILYGSFADGNYGDESDLDMLCFTDNIIDARNDTSIIDGRELDAWIYNTEIMGNPKKFLRIREGKILLDEKSLCEELLSNINELTKKDVKMLTLEQINFQKNWLKKMLNRSKKEDIEGNFRYHWMLVDSLEIYFVIRGLSYTGPKKSLLWLKDNDEDAYKLFYNALKIDSSFEDAVKLVSFIVSIES